MPALRRPSPNAIQLAYEVHRRMIERGMNQKTLALNAGLNETYVRDLFRGKSKNPKRDQLEKLAKALDCDILDLTEQKRPANDPQSGDGVDPASVLPLYPSEVSLVRMWRILPNDARDQVLLRLTELLTERMHKR